MIFIFYQNNQIIFKQSHPRFHNAEKFRTTLKYFMAVTAAIAAGKWPSILRQRYESTATANIRLISKSELSLYASAVRKEKQPRELAVNNAVGRNPATDTDTEEGSSSLRNYFDQCRELISRSDDGPPRWFSPLECRSRLKDSPHLLYLPG